MTAFVLGDSTCGGGDDSGEDAAGHDKKQALKYKLAAVASILVAGGLGVSLPVAGRRVRCMSPDASLFFVVKAFAAGVILATGFVHVLPDAFENLTSPCLGERPWGQFPFGGFIAMLAAMGTLMVDCFATSYFAKRCSGDGKVVAGEEAVTVHVHTHATHGHAHGGQHVVSDVESSSSNNLLRHRVVSQVLEVGIVVHSVIIGVALGASQSPKTIRPLVAALTFHQFFEGMGLGGCIAQAELRSKAIAVMIAFFSLTTLVGIGIGIGISNVYDENSQKALITEGVFNSASAGILIYMALVDLLAADFMDPRMRRNMKLQFGANASLLLGAGLMSLLAKWA
ncbi:unnamed protein product [Cuscuta campestris]|uniref:Uncharacterized protein n=1 Tax=Cuscuta campestris TaxID=132261 RepID=A0A484L2N8_9ASTE|nr:unnamed protein product [Cuscuta campestris]